MMIVKCSLKTAEEVNSNRSSPNLHFSGHHYFQEYFQSRLRLLTPITESKQGSAICVYMAAVLCAQKILTEASLGENGDEKIGMMGKWVTPEVSSVLHNGWNGHGLEEKVKLQESPHAGRGLQRSPATYCRCPGQWSLSGVAELVPALFHCCLFQGTSSFGN